MRTIKMKNKIWDSVELLNKLKKVEFLNFGTKNTKEKEKFEVVAFQLVKVH